MLATSAYFASAHAVDVSRSRCQAQVGRPSVSQLADACADVRFRCRRSDEQRRIVAEIEKQFSRLDEAVANLKRVKANLKRYKAAVLKAAVEGRLVPTEAELARRERRTYETADQLVQRILADGRRNWSGRGKYKEPANVESAELSSLSAGWAWATVAQLAAPEPNAITDGPFGSNLKTEHYQETGPRVIRLQNIGDGEFVDEHAHISIERFQRLQKHEVFAGDLVIATLGENPPRACMIPMHVGPAIVKADCIRFRPHSLASPGYLNSALNAPPTRHRTKDLLHGVGRPRLSLGEIRAIPLPIPPEAEQRRIAKEVDRLLSVAKEVEADIDRRLIATDRLRSGVLDRAFCSDGGKGPTPAAPQVPSSKESASAKIKEVTQAELQQGQTMGSVRRENSVRAALEANAGWLSTAALLKAAGFQQAPSSDEMERFYLELRNLLLSEAAAIEVQRRDGVDYFRRVPRHEA